MTPGTECMLMPLRGRTKDQTPNAYLALVMKERRAFELRKRGLSYQEIAEKENIPETEAMKLVINLLSRATPASREMARRLEIARLDDLYQVAHSAAIDDKNLEAIGPAIKVMERRAKLEGLDRQAEVGSGQQNVQVILNFGEAEPGRDAVTIRAQSEAPVLDGKAEKVEPKQAGTALSRPPMRT